MVVRKSDFDKICRMCLLVKVDMVSIFVRETMTAIKNSVDIEVNEDDRFPKSLCTDCLEKMYAYATFRELCKNSERTLHEILQKDENFNQDTCENYCQPEMVIVDVESIKKEIVVKEESDSDYREDKTDLLIVNKTDRENNDISEEDCSNDVQHVKTMKGVDLSRERKENCKNTEKIQESSPPGTPLKRRRIRMKKHKCDKCSKTYGERSVLAKHLMRAHKAKANLKCDVCGKMFVIQAQLDCHKRVHPRSKTCDICGKEVNRLERHKKSHDRSEKFFCLKCDASFFQESYLETHMKKYHSGTPAATKKEECPLCNKVVSSVKIHNLKVHAHKSHKCDQCDEAFAFKCILLDHVRKKHLGIRDELKALCPTCGKAYPWQGELKKHLRTHTEECHFDCHLCNKRYKSYTGLKFHLQVHAGLRPYVCTHCGNAFYTKVVLENHLRTHTGERPFACAICGRAFTQKAALGIHMKIHSEST